MRFNKRQKRELETTYVDVPCSKCGRTEFGPVDGFQHDLECWGLETALYNVWYRVNEAMNLGKRKQKAA